MAAETDQKLRSEILNLFQYVQRLREEIGRIAQQHQQAVGRLRIVVAQRDRQIVAVDTVEVADGN